MTDESSEKSFFERVRSKGEDLVQRAATGINKGTEVVSQFAYDQDVQRVLGVQLYSVAVGAKEIMKYHPHTAALKIHERLEKFDTIVERWMNLKSTRFSVEEKQPITMGENKTNYSHVHLAHPKGDLDMFIHKADGRFANKVFFSFGYEAFVGSKPLAYTAQVSLENYIAIQNL